MSGKEYKIAKLSTLKESKVTKISTVDNIKIE